MLPFRHIPQVLDWVDTALLNLLAVDPSPIARSALQILFLTFSKKFPMPTRFPSLNFSPLLTA